MMTEWPEEDKTLPISFEQFVNGFHVLCDTVDDVAAYKIYLENNTFRHTYGNYKSHEEWFTAEIRKYLTK